MSTLFPRTISYKHRTAELVNGVWEFSETDGTFTGSVQPLTGKELQFLPEGRRDIGLMKVYSNTPLSVSVEGSNTPGDVVIWAGRKWEIIRELVFANDLINHYKYIAALFNDGDEDEENDEETTEGEDAEQSRTAIRHEREDRSRTMERPLQVGHRRTSKKSEGGKKPSGHGECQGNVYLHQLRRELEPRGLQCV